MELYSEGFVMTYEEFIVNLERYFRKVSTRGGLSRDRIFLVNKDAIDACVRSVHDYLGECYIDESERDKAIEIFESCMDEAILELKERKVAE